MRVATGIFAFAFRKICLLTSIVFAPSCSSCPIVFYNNLISRLFFSLFFSILFLFVISTKRHPHPQCSTMAFKFNWSPLIADASFYTRAQDLLTAALNKSPKPPIIVGDITVTELNLGSIPPELEILEIGDLAEDRFRGIFKMSYTGDAFLTLKTRVQANPLNTYLITRPSFASPLPLAAA
jgi:hypothetical protein